LSRPDDVVLLTEQIEGLDGLFGERMIRAGENLRPLSRRPIPLHCLGNSSARLEKFLCYWRSGKALKTLICNESSRA
jgi:hypothetical protein